MASATGSVWAIDIGNSSLKALHLRDSGGVLEVVGFENIGHGKILNGAGVTAAEREELIAMSLRELVKKHDLTKDEIVVSVPSQNSFARFVNLPPVEQKRIPEIVKFEAAQQIPFDMNDIQWDWQLMSEADSAEIKVGLFAIKNEIVNAELEHFGRESLEVGYVQMSPMALYNYVLFDRPELFRSDREATVIINIGADSTDLVVATKSTVWQRSIPMGGNAFTRAIADAFKLNFEKAEKLKRTAPMSKYARQIFQAMRPVFTDLASEVQRSLGFYTNANSGVKLSNVIALGGGTRLRGLLKYLQQTLQIPVERPESFKRIAMDTEVSAAQFHENVVDLGVVYGLGAQALGYGRIESNLLPKSMARSMAWKKKSKLFNVAAVALLIVSIVALVKMNLDRVSYNRHSQTRAKIERIIRKASDSQSKLSREEGKSSGFEEIIANAKKPFMGRGVIPELQQLIISNLPNTSNTPEQTGLYEAFREGDVPTILEVPRKERKQVFVTNMSVYYVSDVQVAELGDEDFMSKRRSSSSKKGSDMGGDMMGFMEMMGGPMGDMGGFGPPMMDSYGTESDSDLGKEGGPGFIVVISGYSPYENLGELMDPPGVEDNEEQWGFVTRLMKLDDMVVDGNSPFELYDKTNIRHFKLDIGEVSLDAEMPAGVGVEDTIAVGDKKDDSNRETNVLVDPMTREVISKVAVLDENGQEVRDRSGNPMYEINDHWFVLNAKFKWKDAPDEQTEEGF